MIPNVCTPGGSKGLVSWKLIETLVVKQFVDIYETFLVISYRYARFDKTFFQ